jgi:hypothetical protein
MNTHGVQRLTNQHNMPAIMRTQDISLTADTSGNPSPNVSKYNRKVIPVDENLTTFQTSQGLNRRPREKGDWRDNSNLPRAPQIPTLALPEEENGEDLYYSGSESDLGGGLMGTLDDDPEAMLLGCLDDVFPTLFAIEELRFGEFD